MTKHYQIVLFPRLTHHFIMAKKIVRNTDPLPSSLYSVAEFFPFVNRILLMTRSAKSDIIGVTDGRANRNKGLLVRIFCTTRIIQILALTS